MIHANKKEPSLGYSLLTLFVVVAIIAVGIIVFKASAELMLFMCLVAVIPFALRLGYHFSEVEGFAYDMIKKGFSPVLILLAVGALIGSWMLSGTVPTMIYAGINLISPQYFLVTALLFLSVVSLATGTSWGSIGTAGLAMIAVGESMGVPAPMTAGAIICGAYLGDKMSPLSDMTNLAPAVSGTSLIPHIKHMMWTTVPSYIITAVIFLVLGFKIDSRPVGDGGISEVSATLTEMFNIGFVAVIPAIVVLILLIMQKPAFTSIFIGALTGVAVAIFNEGVTISTALETLYKGASFESGSAFIDQLLNRGGITSMYGIITIIIIALGLGGILNGSGILGSILASVFGRVKSEKGVIASSMGVLYISNFVTASTSFTLVITGTLMQPLYEKFNLDKKNLSRVLEDCGTLVGPLIPYGSQGVFVAATIGVDTLAYLPYCFFLFITPVISLIYGMTGWTIAKYDYSQDAEAPEELELGESEKVVGIKY